MGGEDGTHKRRNQTMFGSGGSAVICRRGARRYHSTGNATAKSTRGARHQNQNHDGAQTDGACSVAAGMPQRIGARDAFHWRTPAPTGARGTFHWRTTGQRGSCRLGSRRRRGCHHPLAARGCGTHTDRRDSCRRQRDGPPWFELEGPGCGPR
eukprot:scaffold66817_cov61-Phaeocystis_antarctica.AAC.2